MRIIGKTCIASLLIVNAAIAQTEDFSNVRTELEKRGINLFNFDKFEDFSTCSGEEYYHFMRVSRISGVPEETIVKVREFASLNNDVSEYLNEQISGVPNLVETASKRSLLFYSIFKLHNTSNLELAGKILELDEPLFTNEGRIDAVIEANGGFAEDNTALAAWVIGGFFFPGYPAGDGFFEYDEQTVLRCRSWWIENSDDAIAALKENRRFPSNVPLQPYEAKPTERQTVESLPPPNPIRLPWILGGVALLVIVTILLRAAKGKSDQS